VIRPSPLAQWLVSEFRQYRTSGRTNGTFRGVVAYSVSRQSHVTERTTGDPVSRRSRSRLLLAEA
jgi:hypothetical protein